MVREQGKLILALPDREPDPDNRLVVLSAIKILSNRFRGGQHIPSQRTTAQEHTISRHSNRQAFFETTLLASVPIHSHYRAIVILQALLILDVLLNASSEKTL